MRNLPLSKIRRKPKSFFRNIGNIQKGRRRKSTIEYLVKKSYEALPRGLKEYIEDPEQAVQALTHMIMADGNINPYKALKESAIYTKRKSGDNTRQFIWNRFRTEESALYNKFNSYMYRQGYSARNYWFDNVGFNKHGSIIESYCELPEKASGVAYGILEIDYDFSGELLEAYLY